MITSIPNLLTLSRILVLPALIATFYFESPAANWWALGLFTAAGITDFFDGYLARRRGEMSKLGQFLDPIADKLLVGVTLIMIAAFERIDTVTVIAAVIILSREILVSGLREFLAELQVSVPVTRLAKWKTGVQMTAIGFLLAGTAGNPIPAESIGTIGLWIAAGLTLYTGYDYLIAGLRHLNAQKEEEDGR